MTAEFKKYLKIGILAAVLILIVIYFPQILSGLALVLNAASPLFVGCALAYILNLLLKKLDFPRSQKPFVRKSRRPVCLLLSLVLLVCIAGLVINIVVPELSSSFQLIAKEIPGVIETARQWLLDHSDRLPSLQKALKELNIDWASLSQKLIGIVTAGAGGVFSSVMSLLSSAFGLITNIVIGFIFALYLLLNKEKLCRQLRRIIETWIRPARQEKIMYVAGVAHRTFSAFIGGQCVEAVILGCLCALGMMIFRFPYAAMTGTVIGVTALIPIVGAYIGAAIGAFMILTINPLQAVFFLIFLVILQQLEGNLIYPRVVGTSIGLPGLWVLAAITLGGGLLGISGMILSVPTAATAYKLIREATAKRALQLQAKEAGPSEEPPQDVPSGEENEAGLMEQTPQAGADKT